MTNVEENIPPPSSADQTDDEPDLEQTPESSQAQEQGVCFSCWWKVLLT